MIWHRICLLISRLEKLSTLIWLLMFTINVNQRDLYGLLLAVFEQGFYVVSMSVLLVYLSFFLEVNNSP